MLQKSRSFPIFAFLPEANYTSDSVKRQCSVGVATQPVSEGDPSGTEAVPTAGVCGEFPTDLRLGQTKLKPQPATQLNA